MPPTNEISKKRFSLTEFTTKHMTREKEIILPGNDHFYPSESSVSWIDRHGIKRVSGACMKQVYLRLTGEGGHPQKLNKHNSWIFALGKAVEIILIEQWKQAGIWVDNNIKFYNKDYNISGEIDAVLRDPNTGELFPAEIKSFYGYYATKKIIGSKGKSGRPKTSQLLQLLVYLNECRKYFTHGRLFYAARDSSERKEFIIELHPDEQDPNILWPVVNGATDFRFPVNSIYDRFKLLRTLVTNRQMPENDYELIYSPQKIERFYSIGEIGKTKYNNWKKNPKREQIGDWQCSYCQFCSFCWNKDGTPKVR